MSLKYHDNKCPEGCYNFSSDNMWKSLRYIEPPTLYKCTLVSETTLALKDLTNFNPFRNPPHLLCRSDQLLDDWPCQHLLRIISSSDPRHSKLDIHSPVYHYQINVLISIAVLRLLLLLLPRRSFHQSCLCAFDNAQYSSVIVLSCHSLSPECSNHNISVEV